MLGRSDGLWVAQVLSTAALAVVFLQSGLDKALDWSGNRAYVKKTFEASPLRFMPAGLLLLGLTVLELLTGVVSATGVLLLLTRERSFALFGACLSGVTVLSLLTGQRLAKDYAGAAGLVPYLLLSLAAIVLTGSH